MAPRDLVEAAQIGAPEVSAAIAYGQVALAACDPERLERLRRATAANLGAD